LEWKAHIVSFLLKTKALLNDIYPPHLLTYPPTHPPFTLPSLGNPLYVHR